MVEHAPNGETRYEYEFAGKVHDRLICVICYDPCRDPYMSVCCGHNFCKSCLDKALKAAVKILCPVCRIEKFSFFQNKQAEREINSLRVFCKNKQKGCDWKGELNHFNNHCGTSSPVCLFQTVQCPNRCGKLLERRHIENHAKNQCLCRMVTCQYCKKEGEYKFIAGKHYNDCVKAPVLCPNKCTTNKVPRDEILAHVKVCPLEMVGCEFQSMGCMDKMMRKELQKHKIDCMDKHLTLAIHTISQQQHLIHDLANKVEDSKIEFVRKLEQMQQKVVEDCTKKCFQQVELLKIKVEWERTKDTEKLLSAEQKLNDCQKEIKQLKSQQQTIKDKLKHETEQNSSARSMAQKCNSQINNLTSYMHQTYMPLERSQELETYLNFQLGCHNWIHGLYSTSIKGEEVCPVIVKVPNFDAKKRSETVWESDAFYTHEKGYKVCLQVIPAGLARAKSTHLSLFLYLMKGPYDSQVKWPLKGEFELTLMNQLKNEEHHSYTITFTENTPSAVAKRVKSSEVASEGLGRNEFISLKGLSKITATCQYLKNDCIFIRVCKL